MSSRERSVGYHTSRPELAAPPATFTWTSSLSCAQALPARPSAPSFAHFYTLWRHEMSPQWRRLHRVGVDHIFDVHLLPAFGHLAITAIQRADVMAFRARLANRPGLKSSKLSPSRINKVMTLLHQMLAEAGRRYGFSAPTDGIKRLKVPPADVHPFSLHEVHQLCDTIRKEYRAYLVARFFTGMRTGEINGLTWSNVDFARGEIRVRAIYSAGEAETNVKTAGSFRDIPMLPPVRAALLAHFTARHSDGYVFTSRRGNPIDARNFTNRIWNPLLDQLRLARRRPYQTRHTAATLMLAAGENPEWVARVMGHANTQMLFTVYSRYVPNLTRSDGAAISALLSRQPSMYPVLKDPDSSQLPLATAPPGQLI